MRRAAAERLLASAGWTDYLKLRGGEKKRKEKESKQGKREQKGHSDLRAVRREKGEERLQLGSLAQKRKNYYDIHILYVSVAKCGDYMLSLRLCGFSSGTPASSHHAKPCMLG